MTSFQSASGIYRITCTINGRFYIGSALDLLQRQYLHLSDLRRGVHHNVKLQNAWNKYGASAFVFDVIEFILPPFLLEREQYWLDRLKPFGNIGFNIAHTAQSPYSGMKSSSETRAKISAALKGRSNPNAREPKSEETRARMSEAARKRWESGTDRIVSEETRMKRSLALKGHKQSAETCAKKSASHKGKAKSEETRARMSEAAKLRMAARKASA